MNYFSDEKNGKAVEPTVLYKLFLFQTSTPRFSQLESAGYG